jgi:transcriptional regulator GlxA family with amidase domain
MQSSKLDQDRRSPLVCLLAAPATSPAVLYGLYDVLASAGVIYGEMTTGEAGDPLLEVRIVAAGAEPFRCFGGVLVEPHAAIADVPATDVAIVCDVYTPIDVPAGARYPAEIEWLRRVHADGAVIASVCSGSLILAHSGLLDGLEATGHWAYRQLARLHYPRVRWREDSVLSRSGESARIVTAGGVTAWQDLALYLISRFCGAEHAARTAKVHLLAPHTDGQLPFAVLTQRAQRTDAVIGDCQIWLADHYAESSPVSMMAARSGLSPRTIARRFQAATGYQPIEYVHALRIEEAKQMLDTGPLAVDAVGNAVGYEDPASFRRLFKRVAGITPASYRRKYARIRAGAPSVPPPSPGR